MGYLIEIVNSGSKASRFLFSYDNDFEICEDKLGLICIDTQNQSNSALRSIFNITKISAAEFSVSDSQQNTLKYKSYAELKALERSINIFYLSEQADLNTKAYDLDHIEDNSGFILSCHKLNLNLKLSKNAKISLGSSAFDSIVLRQKGIKPRHVEILLAENLADCEFKACLGQIEVPNQNGCKSFCIDSGESGMLEFCLGVCNK